MARGLVRRRLGSDCEAEDIAQEAVAQALTNFESLRNGQAFVSWFGSIVMRTASKNLRSRMLRRRGLHAFRSEFVPARGEWRPDDALDPRRFVEREPTTARFLMLHAVEDRFLPETAALARISLSTLKGRIGASRVGDDRTEVQASPSAA